jgi:hypothetical protein
MKKKRKCQKHNAFDTSSFFQLFTSCLLHAFKTSDLSFVGTGHPNDAQFFPIQSDRFFSVDRVYLMIPLRIQVPGTDHRQNIGNLHVENSTNRKE